MSETNFDIDTAAAQFDAARQGPPADPPADPPQGEPAAADDGATQEDDTPPGFLTYDEWIDQGKDPEDYVGKKAYERQYNNIQENKGLKDELKGMRETVALTHESTQELIAQRDQEMRTEYEEKLRQAREDEDVDAAIEAQQALDQHDATVEAKANKPAPAPQEPEPIQDFRRSNPIIDPTSDQFDEDFTEDMTALYNTTAHRLSYNGTKQLTERQIQRALNQAMNEAKGLHADKFESPRNTRQQNAGQQRTRRQTAAPAKARAEDFKIANPRNGRDTDASGTANMIRDKAYKGAVKAGLSEEAAQKRAQEQVDNFVESLNRE